VIALEYRGYGIYSGSASACEIIKDAHNLYDYLTAVVGWKENNIILFGRSIGTGPAVHLAGTREPGSLLLMSAYTSIRAIVNALAGNVAKYFIAERFRNIDFMQYVSCPCFLVHGQRDNLIPYAQSQQLHSACKGPSSLLIPEEMDHNEFDFFLDLSQPFYLFLVQCGISVVSVPSLPAHLYFNQALFQLPINYPKTRGMGFFKKLIRSFL